MPQTKAKTEKALSKSDIVAALSESTGLTKAQVNGLFESLASLVGKNIGEGGPGVLPEAVKFQMRPNPLAK